MIRLLFVGLMTVLAVPAIARDPEPSSLPITDCHVFMQVFIAETDHTFTDDRIARIEGWSDQFYTAAVNQAVAEGHADPYAWVDRRKQFIEKGVLVALSNPQNLKEVLGQMDVCSNFGRQHGIID